MKQCKGPAAEIRGGVIVRHVYAADLISIVPRGPDGRGVRDDLLLALDGVHTVTVDRPLDPPPHALRLFDPSADGGQTTATGPGPCQVARDTVERMIRRALRVTCRIPVTGPGFFDLLQTGASVRGDLLLVTRPGGRPVSLAAELIRAGCVTRDAGPADDRRREA